MPLLLLPNGTIAPSQRQTGFYFRLILLQAGGKSAYLTDFIRMGIYGPLP